MDELQVLKDTVAANLPALLHGSEDAAREALFDMQAVCTDGAMFGALCGVLAQVNADALNELRAILPRAERCRSWLPALTPGMSRAEVVATQLVAAMANKDHPAVVGFLAAASSWTDQHESALFLTTVGVRARISHQAVCADASLDARAGA